MHVNVAREVAALTAMSVAELRAIHQGPVTGLES
jgi:hypothetical protein